MCNLTFYFTSDCIFYLGSALIAVLLLAVTVGIEGQKPLYTKTAPAVVLIFFPVKKNLPSWVQSKVKTNFCTLLTHDTWHLHITAFTLTRQIIHFNFSKNILNLMYC